MAYGILGGIEFKLSKEAQQIEAGLNVRISTWNATAEELAADLQKFRSTPVEKLPPKMVEAGHQLGARRLSLLRDELTIVNDLIRYYERVENDRKTAAEKAYHDHEAAREEVRQGLLKMGYVEGVIPGGTANSIIPLFFMNHPKVFAAKSLMDCLQHQSYHDVIRSFDNRRDSILSEIEACRTRAVSLA